MARAISTPFLAPVYVSGPSGAKAACSYRVTCAKRGDYKHFSWGSACHNNATDETTCEPRGTNDKFVRQVFWLTGRANWLAVREKDGGSLSLRPGWSSEKKIEHLHKHEL